MITFILLVVSIAAYATMWTLQFHYPSSIFKPHSYFWDTSISWMNKGKIWIVRTFFVFLTDGFHLTQFVFLNTIFSDLALNMDGPVWLNFLKIRGTYAIVFNLFFDIILVKDHIDWIRKKLGFHIRS